MLPTTLGNARPSLSILMGLSERRSSNFQVKPLAVAFIAILECNILIPFGFQGFLVNRFPVLSFSFELVRTFEEAQVLNTLVRNTF